MKRPATSHWKQAKIIAIFTFIVFISSATMVSAGSGLPADRVKPGVASEESLLIKIDSLAGDYEITGLYAGWPKNAEGMTSETINRGPFALVLTENGELLLKAILVRDTGSSGLEVLVPFSKAWHATEVTLVNVPVSSQADWALKAISIPGDTLSEGYARMRNLRDERIVTKRPGPLIGDCFDTPGGCRLCYFCYEVFGVELCQSPNIYC